MTAAEPGVHEDRGRAGSFGEDAELYDRSRPRYPRALIDRLLEGSPRSVLDVGCGTGIAGLALAHAGCEVLGVEPDERMAAVARRRGLEVEVGKFEDWDHKGRIFDLIACGQAWHWVEPHRGVAKASEVTRSGGRVALFWNQGRHDDRARDEIDDVYRRLAPGLETRSILFRNLSDEQLEGISALLVSTGSFELPTLSSYLWEKTYGRDEWIDYLRTNSDHRTMEPAARDALLDAISSTIDGLGGSLTMHYRCSLVTALRR